MQPSSMVAPAGTASSVLASVPAMPPRASYWSVRPCAISRFSSAREAATSNFERLPARSASCRCPTAACVFTSTPCSAGTQGGVAMRSSRWLTCPITPAASPGLPSLATKAGSCSPTNALMARCAAALYSSGPLDVAFSAWMIEAMAALMSPKAPAADACSVP